MDTAAPAPAAGMAVISAGSDFGIRARRAAEYIVVPLFALAVSAVLFSGFLLLVGKSPVDFYQLVWRGGFGTAFSLQNTLQRAAPLDPHRPCHGHPCPHRPHHDRRRGRAGALRLCGRGHRAAADRPRARARAAAGDGPGGHLRRRPVGRARRLPAPQARRQRNHLLAAADLHRHRHHELLRRGRTARSGLRQQTLDLPDRRRQHDRQDSRHRRALGSRRRHPAGDSALRPDVAHHLRLRGPHHRWQSRAPRWPRVCRSASSSSPAR